MKKKTKAGLIGMLVCLVLPSLGLTSSIRSDALVDTPCESTWKVIYGPKPPFIEPQFSCEPGGNWRCPTEPFCD